MHGLRVKVRETIEIEVRIRVDHAAHDGPLLCGVAVRLDLCVNDGKAIVLDGLARTRELFGDGESVPRCAPSRCASVSGSPLKL